MPQLVNMAGRATPATLTVVANSRLQLKILPSPGEKLPYAVATTAPAVASVEDLKNRLGANFTTFLLKGGMPGRTGLTIAAASGGVAATPLPVEVLAQVALPAIGSEVGLWTWLFLAEVRSPMQAGYSAKDVAESMALIRLVVENRRKKPSGRWSSQGARSNADVVRVPGQFEGFNGYPNLPAKITTRVADMVAIANDASHKDFAAVRAHIMTAIRIGTEPVVGDPTKTGLYWWNTEGAPRPGTGIVLHKAIMGNNFYREGP